MYCLTIFFFFFDILLMYYTRFNSSKFFCLFSGDIYISFGIFVSSKFFLGCQSFELNPLECNSFEDYTKELYFIYNVVTN